MPRLVNLDQRRAEVTDAAARLIARSGLGAATMREVAAEAGWTTGALTHYFADKRELLRATFEASLAHRRSLRPRRDAAGPTDAWRRSLEGVLPIDDDRRRHWMVTVAFCSQAAGDEELAAIQRDAYREFRDHTASLVAAAGLAGPATAGALAERVIAVADGIAVQAVFDPESWPAERQRATLAALLDTIVDGIAPDR